MTREEGGFFSRLSAGLASEGVASLRFDLRGHGESEGRQEELTLSGVLNDINAAVSHLRHALAAPISLVGASFGGGICAYYAAHYSAGLTHLALINPLVNYMKRFIDDKPYWHDRQINESTGSELTRSGFIPHSPNFKLWRPLLNEIFYLRPDLAFGNIAIPTLIIHGTNDSFIPYRVLEITSRGSALPPA